MSAFRVSNESVSMLANFIARYYDSPYEFGIDFPCELRESLGSGILTGDKIFNELMKLNIESLKCRYPVEYSNMIGHVEYIAECDIWKRNVYNNDGCPVMERWHYQILKSLDFYLYQSCEGDCYKTKLYKSIESLRDLWGYYIARNHIAYDIAEWK